jgi:hypothetical protein
MSSEYSPPTEAENFPLALLAAVAIAVLGVVAWAVLAETVQVRTALIAFGVAIGTAAAFRKYAPSSPAAPLIVVVLTVASAVLGLLASQYALVAHDFHLSFFTVVDQIPLSKVPHFLTIGTDALTWIIVALSGYSGYRASMQLRAHQRGASAPRYGAPTPQIPGAQQTAFDDLRAANAAAAAAKAKDDPPQV